MAGRRRSLRSTRLTGTAAAPVACMHTRGAPVVGRICMHHHLRHLLQATIAPPRLIVTTAGRCAFAMSQSSASSTSDTAGQRAWRRGTQPGACKPKALRACAAKVCPVMASPLRPACPLPCCAMPRCHSDGLPGPRPGHACSTLPLPHLRHCPRSPGCEQHAAWLLWQHQMSGRPPLPPRASRAPRSLGKGQGGGAATLGAASLQSIMASGSCTGTHAAAAAAHGSRAQRRAWHGRRRRRPRASAPALTLALAGGVQGGGSKHLVSTAAQLAAGVAKLGVRGADALHSV